MPKEHDVRRVYSVMTVKAVDEERREITGVASAPSTDRHGDIVEPDGAEFKLPIPLLWQHDHSQPIGQVIAAKVTSAGIEIRATLAKVDGPSQLSARLEEAWQSIKAGLVRGLSIGFQPIEYSFIDDGGVRFSRWSWLELSAVTIPANADASITSIKSIDSKLRASSGTKRSGVVRLGSPPPGVTGTKQPSKSILTPKEGEKMSTQEQIKAFQDKRKASVDAMNVLMTKSVDSGASLDAEQKEEFDGHEAEIKEIDEHLGRLEKFAKFQIEKATPIAGAAGTTTQGASEARGGHVIEVKQNLPKGVEFARYVKCLAIARGNRGEAYEVAKSLYPDLHRVHNVIKAAVNAGTTTDPTWAGSLVDYQNFAGDFIDFLRPTTILGQFGANGIPALRNVPFNITVSGQTSGGQGYWVGEGEPKPLTKFDFANVNLRWAKIAAISVLTEELVRFSNPSADALVRDALAGAVRERMDIDFIDPTKAAVANVSPASVTNDVTAIVSTGDPEADVRAVFAAFIAANLSPASGVWIMGSMTALTLSQAKNPLGQREYPELTLTGGRYHGLPAIVSEYASDLLILVNANDVFLADDGQVVIDASREASLQMLDNPTNNSGAGTATAVVSMFQTNSIALRAERFINWQKRRAAAVAYVSGVNYSAPPVDAGV